MLHRFPISPVWINKHSCDPKAFSSGLLYRKPRMSPEKVGNNFVSSVLDSMHFGALVLKPMFWKDVAKESESKHLKP